jgi:hypothetical protein
VQRSVHVTVGMHDERAAVAVLPAAAQDRVEEGARPGRHGLGEVVPLARQRVDTPVDFMRSEPLASVSISPRWRPDDGRVLVMGRG